MKIRTRWLFLAATLLVAGCGEQAEVEAEAGLDMSYYYVAGDNVAYNPSPRALLVVDANRDGIVDIADPEDVEYRFERGGLFLANIDDDAGRCGQGPDTEELHQCSDAQLDYIANEADLADYARMRTAPIRSASPSTYGILRVDRASRDRVRIFLRTGEGDGPEDFELYEPGEDRIDGRLIREGAEFAIAGLELIKDAEVWDGTVELTWEVRLPERGHTSTDQAIMRQAPVLFRHHLDAATVVYASHLGRENREFRDDLRDAVEAAEVRDGTHWLSTWDPWTQDYFENGYMAIPGPEGPQVIQVYFRSANLSYPGSLEEVYREMYRHQMPPLLREAGALVHTELAGPGVAGRTIYHPDKGFEPVDLDGLDLLDVARYLSGQQSQQLYPEIARHDDRIWASDTLDSFGNTETIPPHVAPDGTVYPHGRLVRGHGAHPDVRPDTLLSRVFDSQGKQPTIWLETDWLIVAHVDETISFVQGDNDLGWTLLFADAALARTKLEELRDQGHGSALMFEGKMIPDYSCWTCPDQPAQRTVSQVLNDAHIMAASARSVVEVDAQLAILREEVGIGDEEMVSIPFLMEDTGWGLVAYQPGTVNGISLRPDFFGPPKPHGPRINGTDVFEADFEERLGALGVDVHWIENWDVYHVGMGEVHCASNVERELPATPWWMEEGQ